MRASAPNAEPDEICSRHPSVSPALRLSLLTSGPDARWLIRNPGTVNSKNHTPSNSRSPRVLSLFSGVGGLDLGFVQAGYSPIGAFDVWEAAVAVYRRNISVGAHVLDLSTNTPRPLASPDVVIAGSPCQGFSVLGSRRLDDPRNSLFLRATRLAINLSPQVIVLENVPGILAGHHKHYYDEATKLLQDANYYAHHVTLPAHAVGLPQRRRRIFLIGTRSPLRLTIPTTACRRTLGQTIANSAWFPNHEPMLLHRESEAYQIAAAIGPGQKLCDVRGGPSSVHSWHIPNVFGGTTASQRRLLLAIMRLRRRIRRRPNGDADPVLDSDVRSLLGATASRGADALVRKGYLIRSGDFLDLSRRFNGKYRRLAHNGVSNTVDTRFGDARYFLHPSQHRGLSAREAARIQGFPDSFVFSGSRAEQFRMIGNAVPVPVARAIAHAVRKAVR